MTASIDGVDETIIDGFIRAQAQAAPATLAAAREQLATLTLRPAPSLFLIGSGTSLNALTVAKPRLEANNASAEVLNPATFLNASRPLPDGALVVALSQTGTSETTVAAVRRAQESGAACVTITAEADSPIGRIARQKIVMPIGAESVGPKTKGYTASLAALFALAEALGCEMAPPLAESAVARVIEETTPPAFALAAELDDVDALLFAGSDRHLGTALEASLKIAEMTGVPTASFPIEEVLHGRLHGLTARSLGVIMVANTDERAVAAQAAAVMREFGVRISLINLTGTPTEFDWLRSAALAPPWDALAAIIPAQRLAQAMATRRGIPPHRMRFPGLSARLGIKIASRP